MTEEVPWRLCPLLPIVAAVAIWAAARAARVGVASALAVAAQAMVAALAVAMLASVVRGGPSVDEVGTWLAAGDLLVRLAFVVDAPTAVAAAIVTAAFGYALWVGRQDAQALPWVLAAEATALATVLTDDVGIAVAAWAAAGLCCEAVSRTKRTDGTWDAEAVGPQVWHRVADALALVGFAAVFAQAPGSSFVELADANARGYFTGRVPLVAFVAAMAARSLALSLRRMNAGVASAVLIAGGYALVYRLARVSGAAVWFWVVSSVAVAAAASSIARLHHATNGNPPPRIFALLVSVGTWSGRGVHAVAAWVPDALLLQGPAVIADACARLLRLFHGGDAQRHVGVGLLGLGALIFIVSRPASAPTLDLHVDGLTVRVDAGRGESSQRLEFDYDFDGDGALDRTASGPFASFTYATRGAYAVVVTVRDPLWQTRRTLRATVEVGQR